MIDTYFLGEGSAYVSVESRKYCQKSAFDEMWCDVNVFERTLISSMELREEFEI